MSKWHPLASSDPEAASSHPHQSQADASFAPASAYLLYLNPLATSCTPSSHPPVYLPGSPAFSSPDFVPRFGDCRVKDYWKIPTSESGAHDTECPFAVEAGRCSASWCYCRWHCASDGTFALINRDRGDGACGKTSLLNVFTRG